MPFGFHFLVSKIWYLWHMCNILAPTRPLGFEPGLIAHSVMSQHSNQFGQRVRPTSERLAGRLGCHINSSLPCLVTCHSHQARNMTTSRRWVNHQCAGLYPGLRTSPQCNVRAPTTPLGFEPGFIAHSECWASTLTNLAKGSDLLARG